MRSCLAQTEVEMLKRNGNRLFKWVALAALLGLAACAPTTLEQDYGRSVRHNIAQQLVNPTAGMDTTPAVGLSPTAAAYELEKYNKSFKEEKKATLEMKLTTPSY